MKQSEKWQAFFFIWFENVYNVCWMEAGIILHMYDVA